MSQLNRSVLEPTLKGTNSTRPHNLPKNSSHRSCNYTLFSESEFSPPSWEPPRGIHHLYEQEKYKSVGRTINLLEPLESADQGTRAAVHHCETLSLRDCTGFEALTSRS